MERLLFAKDIIASDLEQEMVEFQKKQEQEAESHKRRQDAELWVRISSRITKMGADTYTGTAIQKAFQKEKNDGFPHRETEFFKELTESGYAISDDEAAGGVTDEIRADSQDTAEELPAPATPKVAPKATPKSKKGNRRMVSFADPAGVPLPDVADTPVKVEVHSEAEAEEELTAEQMEVVQEGIDEVKSLFA